MHARVQAESRGDTVAVCWHNQSYDMRWTNRRTARQDQTEGKKKDRKKKKEKQKKSASTHSSKNQTSISMSSWWGKGDTRDPREGRDRREKKQ